MKRVSLTDLLQKPYPPAEDYALDVVLYDIPETLVAAIRNAPPNCKSLIVSPEIGHRGLWLVGEAARERGIHVRYSTSV